MNRHVRIDGESQRHKYTRYFECYELTHVTNSHTRYFECSELDKLTLDPTQPSDAVRCNSREKKELFKCSVSLRISKL